MDMEKLIQSITETAIDRQGENGCWNVLKEGDKYYNYTELHYYAPKYNSTLWTLVLLADIGTDPNNERFHQPLRIISGHFRDEENGIYAIGKSHFPIPCLNGNMLYLLHYFGSYDRESIHKTIDFFHQYQRFDDGDFKTPPRFPYYSNRSCYGKHTCYWGVAKLFKGLSFIPRKLRSNTVKDLLDRCINFILLHEVCFSSRDGEKLLHRGIGKLTFPNMYNTDFLELLWLLKREEVRSPKLKRALELLRKKQKPDGTWELEYQIKPLTVSITKTKGGNAFVTHRAKEVLEFFQ